jgi:hypothetical protein
MRKHGTERLLEERGEVFGRFAPAGSETDTQGDQGVLRWDPDEGASVELINPKEAWPEGVGGAWFTTHGVTTAGQALTLLNAWVKRRSLGDAELTVRASTLALDEMTGPEAKWARMIVRTAHLHEWLPETGLRWKRDHDKKLRLRKLGVAWAPPPEHSVAVPGGSLTIGPGVEGSPEEGPRATIETSLSVALDPVRPRSLSELRRHFAHPMLALVTLAADRPDTITREIVRNPDSNERAIILHAGAAIESGEWQSDDRFLFRAADLADLARSIRAWYRLWRKLGPALETYTGTVNEGSTFTPGRLLALVTALEAYHRAQLGTGGSLERKLKRLRDYGGIDPALSKCDDRALKLIVATRHWYSHLDTSVPGIGRDQIEDQLLVTTRRAAALMQGCLLRNLGVTKKTRNELFSKHYRNWPLAER